MLVLGGNEHPIPLHNENDRKQVVHDRSTNKTHTVPMMAHEAATVASLQWEQFTMTRKQKHNGSPHRRQTPQHPRTHVHRLAHNRGAMLAMTVIIVWSSSNDFFIQGHQWCLYCRFTEAEDQENYDCFRDFLQRKTNIVLKVMYA